MEIPARYIDTYVDSDIITLKATLDTIRTNNTAHVLYSHNIGAGGLSLARFEEIVDYAQSIGVEIVTMAELYTKMI